MEQNPWETKKITPIYENAWIKVEEHDVVNPAGNDGIYGKVHFKNRAMAIIPLDTDLNTWLIGQYRYTLGEYAWEIPMGGGLMEEDQLESAKRELKEETGLSAEKWTAIMKIHLSNSVTDEVGYVYLAEDLTQGETEFEETEVLKVKKLPFVEAVEMVMTGKITDAISVAAILKAARILNL
ncbi:8-oxo-dGTP pyrophosphatase MutT (NUDIX family) [Algoriphagus ratkowskyi]|uniref:GDP-mannose pyrophosphatase n=1 Tax=Algoriphagus ratkowskyi TaxID=57028 RepID=A0A2W7QVW2_9BACT|nr:NUDIX hydrolase [Algoriphagus ratkowskyi]PZX52414.1 8-oxo-dGTP pyrophosphatase MutT (NUDIX family) [Algoriphagus ratkowskyi]TXD76237.1 NUDIX hydrolase [Algoriphagus ratkowskyi]